MATGPLTGTRYATEFRAQISKVGRRIVGAYPVGDKSARDESRWDNGRKKHGRNRRKVPASAARTTTVRIGGSKPHDGGIRRAHKTSLVHPSPP